MIKILIIGKRGFIGNKLAEHLKNKFLIKHISFNNFKLKKNIVNDFNWIINSSISKNYIKQKYNKIFDNDLKIAEYIKNKKILYIFLSTRKVYKIAENIKENGLLRPRSHYSKNKLISEKKIQNILKKKVTILRVSNIIGDKSNYKKLHSTFLDVFLKNIKDDFIIDNGNNFKDFISIKKFCEIVSAIIKKKLIGTYNVSIGEKIYLYEIIDWLNKYNKKKFVKKNIKIKKDNFYLNNRKLMFKIKIKNSKTELKNYCFFLSKKIFSTTN